MEHTEETTKLIEIERKAKPTHISPIVIVIGLALTYGAIWIVAYSELVVKQIQIAICQFSPIALGMTFIVAVTNYILSSLFRRTILKPSDIITIYVMVAIGTMIASRGLMEKLIPVMVAINYYATPENRWVETFYPHIKPWLVPFDPYGLEKQPVARYFYEGIKEGAIPWGDWIRPLLSWSIIVLAIYCAFICMATLFRRQWVDNEKLTFPLTQPPMQLAETSIFRSFITSRLAWIGFLLPTIIFTINGLHTIYPTVPEIRLQHNLNQYFTQRPWNAMPFTTVYGSLAAIGFGYFLPTQLLFSLWVFFWIARLQSVLMAWLGLYVEAMPLYPTHLHMGYQVAGAYIVLTAFMLRSAFPHLKQVVLYSLGIRKHGSIEGKDELLPIGVAFWGLLISFIVAVLWSWLAGMSLWFAIVEIGIYLGVVVLVMARSVAEAGLMMTETSFRPVDIVQLFIPARRLEAKNLTPMCFLDAVFTRDLRGLLLTPMLDALKMADTLKFTRRALLIPIITTILFALVTSCHVELLLPYKYGAVNMYGYAYWGNCIWGFGHAMSVLQSPERFPYYHRTSFAIGIAVTMFLSFMRSRYWWWSLYPLGYALSASWTMIVFWFPVMMAWAIKSLILRYGGMTAYTRLRPLFIGLIFGEFFMAIVWATYAMVTRKTAPFFPWP
ncbi:MAG: DUF6785 family protein [Armatimonadota bacterium]|nr:hypothetical protein [Armatimonadota bacterium]MCX7777838.1 hypothetical protein [Armatimonadota bacterium]MDW8025829.1 DUF6785 family protein [Armatimonadota bacterium]